MQKDIIIDFEEVMERVQDDKELLIELFDIFVEDYANKREQLQKFVNNNEFQEIKDIAHSMKGAAGNISAKAIHLNCAEIEMQASKQNTTMMQDKLKGLDEKFNELTEYIKELKIKLSE